MKQSMRLEIRQVCHLDQVDICKNGFVQSDDVLCILGKRLFVSMSGTCKDDKTVFHSSTETEITLDSRLRLEDLRAFFLFYSLSRFFLQLQEREGTCATMLCMSNVIP